jgi:hypothetical protein
MYLFFLKKIIIISFDDKGDSRENFIFISDDDLHVLLLTRSTFIHL